MKKITSTIMFASVLLSACGGGSNSNAPVGAPASSGLVNETSTPVTTDVTASDKKSITVSGQVLNVGYLSNVQVCADLDADDTCSSGDPSTITDASARYTLTLPRAHRGLSLLAVVRPDSIDSASTSDNPVTIQQGWTLPTLLEYEDDVTALTLNISPITATYFARMRVSGRSRLSNQINMFTRIVYDTNVDRITGNPLLPIDFDYVANPRNTLAERLRAINVVLSERAQSAGVALDTLTTTAILSSWYNTYISASASNPASPVDASRIAGFADSNTSSVAYFLAQNYRYFKLKTDAALRLREELTETAGWKRSAGEGRIDTFDRRAHTLANGAVVQIAERLENNAWRALTVEETAYYTFAPDGTLTTVEGTDYLQPRTISHIDGNRVSFRMPGNQTPLTFDVADNPGTNFFIEEWLGQQRDYGAYYNGSVPAVAPFAEKPACVQNYIGSPQPNTDARLNSTAITDWYRVCFDYYTAEYYDQQKSDVELKYADPELTGANFYDATLQKSIVVLPQSQACGTDANALAKVTVLGKAHCNWVVDAESTHQMSDLFAEDGVVFHSWTKTYGTQEFTSGGASTTRTAGTLEQVGLPQQLTLKLHRHDNATSGTGTLSSPYGAWTATSFSDVTETVQWELSSENPNLVLISWPFRDVNDPRVKTGAASDGSTAVSAPVLAGGHFGTQWNGNAFSPTPSTHTAPNYRKLAILLQDGVFLSGQYYGTGYTYSERYFTTPALSQGIEGMNYVFGKLYGAGFVDQE